MTQKQLCEMCTKYSADTKCEFKDSCELQKILTENIKLRQELKQVKSELEELEYLQSWDRYPEGMGR